jgi:type I restriction enzyme S subunit
MFSAYPRYKTSGIEWLGNLPEHWEIDRIKRVSTRVTDGAHISPDLSSPDFPFVSTVDISDGRIDFDGCLRTSEDCYDYLVHSGCRPHKDDLLFSKDGTVGRTAVVDAEREFVVASSLVIISPQPTRLSSTFLDYWVNNTFLQQDILLQMSGAALRRISVEKVSRLPVFLPPVAEQNAIAAFLDVEAQRMNRLVRKKRELIERLREKRAALISHAVTRGLPPSAAHLFGLDPHPPLKASGIEWLGDVPEHWEVVRIGRKIQLQRGVDITKDEQNEGVVPVVSSGGVASFHDRAIASGPGVVVGRKGTAGAVYYVESDFWPHDTTLWVKEFRGNYPRFVFYKLSAMDLSSFDTGSANPTVNRNLVHPVMVSWPPIGEQHAISHYLDGETSRIDNLVASVEAAIERVGEYRSALITAAVTGKIDVRKVAAGALLS